MVATAVSCTDDDDDYFEKENRSEFTLSDRYILHFDHVVVRKCSRAFTDSSRPPITVAGQHRDPFAHVERQIRWITGFVLVDRFVEVR